MSTTAHPSDARARVAELAAPWIRRFGETRPGPVVVCLPHAGGAATFYRPLAELLADHAEVWAVQYPGRQDRLREEFCTSMDELVRSVAAALLVMGPDRRFVLFGHSMGALVAFRVATILEEAGHPVAHVVASGRGAPSIPFTGDAGTGSDEELVAELLSMEGTDPLVLAEPQLLELTLPAVRADYRLIRDHAVPEDATVSCPVTVVHGDADPLAPAHEVAVWRRHSTSSVQVHEFTGGHFFLVDHLSAVAATVVEVLP